MRCVLWCECESGVWGEGAGEGVHNPCSQRLGCDFLVNLAEGDTVCSLALTCIRL
jgi:hypothetical protein